MQAAFGLLYFSEFLRFPYKNHFYKTCRPSHPQPTALLQAAIPREEGEGTLQIQGEEAVEVCREGQGAGEGGAQTATAQPHPCPQI